MSENSYADTFSEQQNPNLFYLSDLWKGIFKFWWVFVLFAVLGGCAAYLKSYINYTPVYSTSCTLAINTDSSNSLYSTSYNSAIASEISTSFSNLLSTNILQNAICNDLDIDYVSAYLEASAVSDTNMVIMRASGPKAQETYDIMMSAIKNYPSIARYMFGNTEINMITEPYVPVNPGNANKNKRSAVNGALFGLALGAVWILLYVAFRKTIRTREDIKNRLGFSALGVLPLVSFKKYNKDIDKTIIKTNSLVGSSFQEALRLLRNTVLHNLSREDKVIVFSSAAPGEGKSTVAANIAASLAESGKKVLLIDGDIRNPSINDILAIDYKFENEEETYALTYDDKNKVSVIVFNTISKKRLWKIMRVEFWQNLVNMYRSEFDYIIIDTPPCGLISDASVIAQAADKAIFVILQDVVRISRIKNAISNFTSSGIRLIGCVLNGAASGMVGYGENYGYGSYYRSKIYERGYGKAYGSYSRQRSKKSPKVDIGKEDK